ncbi:MAG: U32 family peptidase [Syntrophomonadaceae bacterium]|nr:U32 family peptidase [Syntrophomonadaceae bacterium]
MELLAPAGNWESFIAAVNNGADAIYLGGQRYSARQSAANFDHKQLREAIEYAHLRDRKVYVTVNTLIDNDEFAEVLDYLWELSNAGADAVILQDMGLLNAARTVLPGLRIHASTQMTIHNQDGAGWLEKQGVKRIVLARELSLAEITAIYHAVTEVELEVFVHGAHCYCYSGQCLFSSMVGGRSGNRGRCAQPCRLPYDLYNSADRQKINLPDQGKYLLSPADLCLIDYLPQLQAAGVHSLKIEGRMKRPEYVAVVTRAYREVLDRLQEDPGYRPEPAIKERLLRIFNRNFSSGYLFPGNPEFMSTSRPNNRGVYVGRVVDQDRDMTAKIKLTGSVRLGDGLAVWVGKGHIPAVTVKEMKVNGKKVAGARPGEIIEIKLEGRVFEHDRVFKTHDEDLLQEAQESMRPDALAGIPVDAYVYIEAGQALRLVLADDKGNQAETATVTPAQIAEQHPLTEEILRRKIGRLGHTPFALRDLYLNGDKNLLVPLSELNEARRRAAELLRQKILGAQKAAPIDSSLYWAHKDKYLLAAVSKPARAQPLLTVVVSQIRQAEGALRNGADLVYWDMQELGARRHADPAQITKLLSAESAAVDRIIPVLPRIHKPGEALPYREMAQDSLRRVMIASWADLEWALQSGLDTRADYSLNIFNRYTRNFLARLGVAGMCLSPELNLEQLAEFGDLNNAELMVHGDLIIMESQYCLLGGVLGRGKKCTAPCAARSYYLKDGKGFEFPVATDADCRFYVFNSRTLCMMEELPRIVALKPGSLRIEARVMPDGQLEAVTSLYREALDQVLNGNQPDLSLYKQELSTVSNSAFTKGHYYRGVI